MGGKAEVARKNAISSSELGMDPETFFGGAVDFLGHVIRTPGKVLGSTDEFFKLLNFRMQQHALTWREANRVAGITGETVEGALARLRTEVPDSIMLAAREYGSYQTYTNDLGRAGQALVKFSNSNIVAKSILPFVRTPINLAKYTLERTPILNLTLTGIRHDIASGGAAGQLAMAKAGLGAMFLTTASVYALSGGITGSGPQDPVLRRRLQESGWQPYSLKVGNTYYSYSRLDPIGMALGMIGDYNELIGNVDEVTTGKAAMAVLSAVLQNISSKTYVQGLANALEAITNPESKGFQSYFELQARTVVPRFVAGIARANDPTVREIDGIFDAIRSQIPGYTKDLPPRRDLFGRPVMLEGSLGPDYLSPIYAKTIKQDPVIDEIVRHQIRVDSPGDWIGGGRPPKSMFRQERASHGIRLSPEERDMYALLTAQGSNKPLRDTLEELIHSDSYRTGTDGPDGSKAYMIQKTVREFKEFGQQRLLEERPDIRVRLDRKLSQRREAHGQDVGLRIGP